MSSSGAADLISRRIVLPLLTVHDVTAVVSGDRRPDWAPDFPAPGDLEIAGFLHRTGLPSGPAAAFGHRLVRERDTGLVVGGAGFHGPPDDGRVELGYGIVPSRRRRGYATEAVVALVLSAWRDPSVAEVFGRVEPGDSASAGVLRMAGFLGQESGAECEEYAVFRPV